MLHCSDGRTSLHENGTALSRWPDRCHPQSHAWPSLPPSLPAGRSAADAAISVTQSSAVGCPYRSRPGRHRRPTVGRHRSTGRRPPTPPRPISIYNSPGGRGRRRLGPGFSSCDDNGSKRRRVSATDKVSGRLRYLLPAARRSSADRPYRRPTDYRTDSTRRYSDRDQRLRLVDGPGRDGRPDRADYLHYSSTVTLRSARRDGTANRLR